MVNIELLDLREHRNIKKEKGFMNSKKGTNIEEARRLNNKTEQVKHNVKEKGQIQNKEKYINHQYFH